MKIKPAVSLLNNFATNVKAHANVIGLIQRIAIILRSLEGLEKPNLLSFLNTFAFVNDLAIDQLVLIIIGRLNLD